MTINYYTILGLKTGASEDAVKTAYHRQVKMWHPDRQPASRRRFAEQRMRLINLAYGVLKDSKQKTAYDRILRQAVRGRAANDNGGTGRVLGRIVDNLIEMFWPFVTDRHRALRQGKDSNG